MMSKDIFIGIVCFIGGNFSEENFGLAISFRGMLTLGYNSNRWITVEGVHSTR